MDRLLPIIYNKSMTTSQGDKQKKVGDEILITLFNEKYFWKKFPVTFKYLEMLSVFEKIKFIDSSIDKYTTRYEEAQQYADIVNDYELPSPKLVEWEDKGYKLTPLGRKFVVTSLHHLI